MLSHVTNARVAALADWQLNFATVTDIVDALSTEALPRAEILGQCYTTPTGAGTRHADRLLQLLCGKVVYRHLWEKDQRGLYRLLPSTQRAQVEGRSPRLT
jgi:hypothetical protein